jgi:hypothetical protein
VKVVIVKRSSTSRMFPLTFQEIPSGLACFISEQCHRRTNNTSTLPQINTATQSSTHQHSHELTHQHINASTQSSTPQHSHQHIGTSTQLQDFKHISTSLPSTPTLRYNRQHISINTSPTRQHINTSPTRQHINTSTHQHINTSTH